MSGRPLYELVKERIREDLLKQPEDAERLPSERELQERYSVSRPTISKALAALAGEGLLVRQSRRGNFTSGQNAGRRNVGSETRQIGFVAPLTGEELVQRCFRGIDRIAHRRGYQVVMGNAGNSVAREENAVRDLIASGATGLIITPVPRRIEETEDDYLRRGNLGVPFVLADTCLPAQGGVQVMFDNGRLGYAMTEWLIQQGHRRIALLTYVWEVMHTPLSDRFAGYREALRDFAGGEDEALIARLDTQFDHEAALIPILDAWRALPEPPTAIITPEDTLAVELIALLMSRGVPVPEEMRVVGFDNRSVARHFHPPIPTSDPDFERLGETACRLLLDAMQSGEAAPRTVYLDAPLLIRKRLAAYNGATSAALK